MPSSPLPGLCLLLLAATVTAQPAPPQTPELVASNSHAFTYTATTLSGAGADLLRRELADTQFVLFGEDHMDHATPVFAGALFRMLHESHGFRHLVVEQDPVAIEEALEPERRGDVERLAGLAKLYPSLFEFDSDEDLGLLAEVAAISEGPDAIWGVEQATGAVRYLEELVDLAPDRDARARAQMLLRDAQAADPGPRYSVNWLAAPATPAAIEALAQRFQADAGSRAARLIAGLAKSAEVFGYYRRAEAGEFVGLYNNTEREAVLKRGFLQRYQAVARTGAPPKAMFKFGANHMYHGKNPSQAFPIGNLAHELAIANGATVAAAGNATEGRDDRGPAAAAALPAPVPGEGGSGGPVAATGVAARVRSHRAAAGFPTGRAQARRARLARARANAGQRKTPDGRTHRGFCLRAWQ